MLVLLLSYGGQARTTGIACIVSSVTVSQQGENQCLALKYLITHVILKQNCSIKLDVSVQIPLIFFLYLVSFQGFRRPHRTS